MAFNLLPGGVSRRIFYDEFQRPDGAPGNPVIGRVWSTATMVISGGILVPNGVWPGYYSYYDMQTEKPSLRWINFDLVGADVLTYGVTLIVSNLQTIFSNMIHLRIDRDNWDLSTGDSGGVMTFIGGAAFVPNLPLATELTLGFEFDGLRCFCWLPDETVVGISHPSLATCYGAYGCVQLSDDGAGNISRCKKVESWTLEPAPESLVFP